MVGVYAGGLKVEGVEWVVKALNGAANSLVE